MTLPAADDITQLLQRLDAGDAGAEERLYGFVYGELRELADGYMRRERPGHTLQATALVHEAYLRVVRRDAPGDGAGDGAGAWTGREHFLRVAARAMRAVLVDHARRRAAQKRAGENGGGRRLELDEMATLFGRPSLDVLAIHETLERLAGVDADLARVVELRFFGGLTIAETASALGVSTPTVQRGWRTARAWMMIELGV